MSSISNIKHQFLSGALLIICMSASVVSFAQTAVVPSGTGDASDPYQIIELGNLVWMSDTVTSSSGKYYKLMNTIDATATKDWNEGVGFSPIGVDKNNQFAGIFNGNGKSITNLTINRSTATNIGMFGHTAEGSKISNIGLVDCNIYGKSYVGGLVGMSFSSLSNCYVSGTVGSVGATVGGLVGYLREGEHDISNCVTEGTVTCGGYSAAGGLVGSNGATTSTIENCYSTADVTITYASGGGSAGGLVGSSSVGTKGIIRKCYATGNVVVTKNSAGGLVGNADNFTIISDSYATGAVEGADNVGGLVGYIGGTNISKISNCYSIGRVTSTKSKPTYIGGLVGRAGTIPPVTGSYYNSETSGQSDTTKGTPKTTAEMKMQATYDGWDFSNTWFMPTNNYPIFAPASYEKTVDASGVVDFPLVSPRTLIISGMTPGAVVTLKSYAGNVFNAPNPPFSTPTSIYKESLSLSATGLAEGMNATITWPLDLAAETSATISKVYRVVNNEIVGEFDVSPSNHTLTISGVSGFSDWYAGSPVDVPVTMSGLEFE